MISCLRLSYYTSFNLILNVVEHEDTTYRIDALGVLIHQIIVAGYTLGQVKEIVYLARLVPSIISKNKRLNPSEERKSL